MVHTPLGTRRLFGKFMLLLLPIFAAATAAGLILVSQFFMRDEQNLLNARIGNLSARVSSIIATQSPANDPKALESYLGILMADPAVRCVELTAPTGERLAANPHRIGCKGQERYEKLNLRQPDSSGALLTIRYSSDELATIRGDKQLFTQLALLVGVLVAGLASWIGFRVFIGRPVGTLLAAMQQCAETGEPATVASPPNDELGTVITAFNDMQLKLRDEAQRNLTALRRLDHVYNETPALMFSIRPDGHISSVSGHWLDKTGYRRQDVLGRPLRQFLLSPDGHTIASLPIATHEVLNEFACQVRCKDGSRLDVLLSSIPGQSGSSSGNDHLCVMSDVSGLVAARRTLHEQLMTDQLTRLPNRTALFEHLAGLSGADEKKRRNSSILFVDLDNFKWVNDTHGHETGDALLLAAAARIRNCISANDFLARLGGDEFALVLHGVDGNSNSRQIAARIIAQLSLPFQIGLITTFVGCSVGIADGDLGASSSEEQLRFADLAMYKSKQDGRNRATSYSAEFGQRAQARDVMLTRIREALARDHFELHCQPIVDVSVMQPAGAEALLRLNSPDMGIIGPAEVIRTAEETGMMAKIGGWVVDEGFAMAERWRHGGHATYTTINLSPRQLDGAFMAVLVERLRANPETARRLVFEITESTLLNNADRIVQFFADIRQTGARIALDDFGTGYSALNYISRFPVDFVKLDRSFIRNLDDRASATARRNLALVRSTAMLCDDLDIAVVAEGVETMGELKVLQSIGIRYCQGYLFSRPLPEHAFLEWTAHFGPRAIASANLALTG